jgi:hypothetical protein
MSTAAARLLTAEERTRLEALPPPTPPFRLLWRTGVGSFGATGCLGGMAILAVGAFLGSFKAAPGVTSAVIAVVVGLVVITASISTALRYSIARRKELEEKSRIDADLAGGVAAVERYGVTHAVRAVLEEHGVLAYFLRLADGRTLYVGYWRPAEGDSPEALRLPPESESFPSTEVEIARGPASGRCLGIAPGGTPLPPSTTFECRFRDAVPQPGDFIPQPWDSIPAFYSSDFAARRG